MDEDKRQLNGQRSKC